MDTQPVGGAETSVMEEGSGHEPTRHSICTHPHILHIKITKEKITPVIMHPFCFVVLQSVGFHYNIWCVYI